MRGLVLLLLALCCFLAAARKNGEQTLAKEYGTSEDTQVVVGKSDPFLQQRNGCGTSYDCIYIKNACSVTLYVASIYYSLGSTWMEGGPWALSPGQTAFVFATQNRYFYIHAENKDAGIVFGDNAYVYPYKGLYLPFIQADIGPYVGSYTITLNCSSKKVDSLKDLMDASIHYEAVKAK